MALKNLTLRAGRFFGNTTNLNSETVTWIANVAANGGTLTRLDIASVDAGVTYAKAQGIWTLLDRVNFRCGDFNACLVPIKGSGNDANFGAGTHFNSSDYTEATGLKGDGVSKALTTGYTPSATGPVGDMAIYISTSPTATSRNLYPEALSHHEWLGTSGKY